MQTTTFIVDGMSCEHCVRAVKEAVSAISGVTAVEVVLKSRTVEVSGDNFSREAVVDTINGLGYKVVA